MTLHLNHENAQVDQLERFKAEDELVDARSPHNSIRIVFAEFAGYDYAGRAVFYDTDHVAWHYDRWVLAPDVSWEKENPNKPLTASISNKQVDSALNGGKEKTVRLTPEAPPSKPEDAGDDKKEPDKEPAKDDALNE